LYIGLDEILFNSDEEWKEDENEEDNANQSSASYACEDCDYRWDAFTNDESSLNGMGEEEEDEIICPMCGSTYITQI
jgi:predicted RNA-binding Zn-ribbon protein involved in translation (DUF1610 family)